jgi:Sec-independent protein translocase protein TatA
VFGPTKLPEVGRQVGGALREFRKVQDSVRSEIKSVIDETNPATVLRSPPEPRTSRAAPSQGASTDMTDPAVAGAVLGHGAADDVNDVNDVNDAERDIAREELGLPAGPSDPGPAPASGSFS